MPRIRTVSRDGSVRVFKINRRRFSQGEASLRDSYESLKSDHQKLQEQNKRLKEENEELAKRVDGCTQTIQQCVQEMEALIKCASKNHEPKKRLIDFVDLTTE